MKEIKKKKKKHAKRREPNKGRKKYKSDPKRTLAIKRRKCKSPFPGQSAGAHCLDPNKNSYS